MSLFIVPRKSPNLHTSKSQPSVADRQVDLKQRLLHPGRRLLASLPNPSHPRRLRRGHLPRIPQRPSSQEAPRETLLRTYSDQLWKFDENDGQGKSVDERFWSWPQKHKRVPGSVLQLMEFRACWLWGWFEGNVPWAACWWGILWSSKTVKFKSLLVTKCVSVATICCACVQGNVFFPHCIHVFLGILSDLNQAVPNHLPDTR